MFSHDVYEEQEIDEEAEVEEEQAHDERLKRRDTVSCATAVLKWLMLMQHLIWRALKHSTDRYTCRLYYMTG